MSGPQHPGNVEAAVADVKAEAQGVSHEVRRILEIIINIFQFQNLSKLSLGTFGQFSYRLFPGMRKFSRECDYLFPDNADGAFRTDIPAYPAETAHFAFEVDPLTLPNNKLYRAKINTSGAILGTEFVGNDQPADKLRDDLNGLGAADLQALGAAQTQFRVMV